MHIKNIDNFRATQSDEVAAHKKDETEDDQTMLEYFYDRFINNDGSPSSTAKAPHENAIDDYLGGNARADRTNEENMAIALGSSDRLPDVNQFLIDNPDAVTKSNLDLINTLYNNDLSKSVARVAEINDLLKTAPASERSSLLKEADALNEKIIYDQKQIKILGNCDKSISLNYERELSLMEDTNGDGMIGEDFAVFKKDDGTIGLINVKTLQLAHFSPFKKPPVLASSGATISSTPATLSNGEKVDATITFEGQDGVTLQTPEYIWVKKGEDGKPKLDEKDPGQKVIAYTKLSSEGGMVKIDEPTSKENWMKVKVTGTKIWTDENGNQVIESYIGKMEDGVVGLRTVGIGSHGLKATDFAVTLDFDGKFGDLDASGMLSTTRVKRSEFNEANFKKAANNEVGQKIYDKYAGYFAGGENEVAIGIDDKKPRTGITVVNVKGGNLKLTRNDDLVISMDRNDNSLAAPDDPTVGKINYKYNDPMSFMSIEGGEGINAASVKGGSHSMLDMAIVNVDTNQNNDENNIAFSSDLGDEFQLYLEATGGTTNVAYDRVIKREKLEGLPNAEAVKAEEKKQVHYFHGTNVYGTSDDPNFVGGFAGDGMERPQIEARIAEKGKLFEDAWTNESDESDLFADAIAQWKQNFEKANNDITNSINQAFGGTSTVDVESQELGDGPALSEAMKNNGDGEVL